MAWFITMQLVQIKVHNLVRNQFIMVDLFQEKVNAAQGTWIDWQYLFDAAKLLAKCR